MECRQALNLKQCTCSYASCSRKGFCCECVEYHRKAHELPGCFFPPDAERTYDRSLAGSDCPGWRKAGSLIERGRGITGIKPTSYGHLRGRPNPRPTARWLAAWSAAFLRHLAASSEIADAHEGIGHHIVGFRE